jgi:hypothetical protein
MCLNANVKEKKVEIITLEEDLIVYKLLAENFRSLYEDFPYELNKLYKTSFKRVEIRNGEISKGFHSYSDTKRIEEIEGSGDYNDGILVKCIIPKGTKIIKGRVSYDSEWVKYENGIVSEAIIIKEKIEKNEN